nr:helix-turn-helix transcriptional regulator [Micromonospora sp. DSM 115978]
RLHSETDGVFEFGRTALLYGQELRRRRRNADAKGHLHDALHLFQQCGARHWESRAQAELRAAGEHVTPKAPSSLQALSPQQLQVARLVAIGATNREIAAELVISPRTVDHHLRNTFARLGIRSRTELARILI